MLLKTENLFPGYYKRPEVTAEVFDADGYYRTGDVVAEVAPNRLVYVDRRNNVLKLAQGEFVTVAKLEAEFGNSPLVRQIYVYGNSAHPYLLGVVVPTEEALANHDPAALKPLIADSLQNVAKESGLQSYEVPRDFIIETTPFTLENGLLTGIRKLAWPKLKQHYGERLEQLYTDLAAGQANELHALRQSGADAHVLQTVSRAAAEEAKVRETESRIALENAATAPKILTTPPTPPSANIRAKAPTSAPPASSRGLSSLATATIISSPSNACSEIDCISIWISGALASLIARFHTLSVIDFTPL